jgi:hypothetical protein
LRHSEAKDGAGGHAALADRGLVVVEDAQERLEREADGGDKVGGGDGVGSSYGGFVVVHGDFARGGFVRASIEGGADTFARAKAPVREGAEWLNGGAAKR